MAMRPRRSRLILIALPMLAVFAAFGAVVWLASEDGSYGSPVGEPPLVEADPSPIKLAPDDPGGREIADQGQVRELLAESLPAQPMERLLPPEEEPLTPLPSMADDATRVSELPPADASPGDAATPAVAPEIVTERAVPDAPIVTAPAPAPVIATPAPAPEPVIAEPAPTGLPSSGTGGPVGDGRSADGTPSEAEAALDALLAEVTGRQPPQPAPSTAATDRATPPASRAPAGRDVVTARPAPQEVRPAVTIDRPSPSPTATTRPAPVGRSPAGTSVADIAPGEPLGQIPARGAARSEPGEPLTVVVVPRIEQAPGASSTLEGRFRVQLAAVRAEADARRAWDLFQVDLGSVLQGLQPYIERADTSNGTFYRVQVGSFVELAEAETLCEDLKQRNASCFVVRR